MSCAVVPVKNVNEINRREENQVSGFLTKGKRLSLFGKEKIEMGTETEEEKKGFVKEGHQFHEFFFYF